MPGSNMNLSTVVMTHPQRLEPASRLRDEYPELRIRLVTDPEPDAEPGTLRTARLAWDSVAPGATHQLVLQDDIQPCAGFPAAVSEAIQRYPGRPLAFFANWACRAGQAVRLAALSGASWAPAVDDYVPTQALVLPAGLAHGFAAYTTGLGPEVPDDQAMCAFLRENGLVAFVSVPNLVEHQNAGSLLWNDIVMGVRRSVAFLPDPSIDPDWQRGGTLVPVCVPFLETWAAYTMAHFPGRPARARSVPAHELLASAGLGNSRLVAEFSRDRDQTLTGSPAEPALGPPFLFQVWLTSFTSGIVAAPVLGSSDPAVLGKAMERPFAREALGTFPAGALRRMMPPDLLAEMGAHLVPLCSAGLRSGFTAVARWPRLAVVFGNGPR
jgi:hypothetical protein